MENGIILEELEFGEAVKRVGDALADAGDAVLVIDQVVTPGFPALMVMMPAKMPIFVWVMPSKWEAASKTWKAAKAHDVDTFCQFGAACRDIETDADLKALCELIAEVQPRAPATEQPATEEPAVGAAPAADNSWLD